MASIVMADDGIAFDGAMAASGPLGGAETAFVALAEALAARGHRVEARSNCAAMQRYNGVEWAPLAGGVAERCDRRLQGTAMRSSTLPTPGADHARAHGLIAFGVRFDGTSQRDRLAVHADADLPPPSPRGRADTPS